MRIVSTVPSITELLHDLGLNKEVIGITKFCVHPNAWFRTKERIGGTKSLNISKIKELNPTHIICNKEENVEEQIEQLRAYADIHLTDIKTPKDNLELITTLGTMTDNRMTAIKLRAQLEAVLNSLYSKTKKTALYLIWKDPYMTIGSDTYIHAIMEKIGLINIFGAETRYPQITINLLQSLKPEVVLLSSEPYPFKEEHRSEFSQLFPSAQVHLVDGEAFSWYGTRLIKKGSYLNELVEQLTP